MVLVQGTAEVDDRDLDANRERYARESAIKLPATAKMQPPEPSSACFGWYYTRIYIHVRPERIYVWPRGDIGERARAVRRAHGGGPLRSLRGARALPRRSRRRRQHLGPADRRARHPYPTAVLSIVSPDGFPFSLRVPVRVDGAKRWIRIEGELPTVCRCSPASRA